MTVCVVKPHLRGIVAADREIFHPRSGETALIEVCGEDDNRRMVWVRIDAMNVRVDADELVEAVRRAQGVQP